MKKSLLLLSFLTALFIFFSKSNLQAQSIFSDSLVYQNTKIDDGAPFYFGYFTNYGHYKINSFIEDVDGTLHLAYVDNYDLYYYKSTDNGENWEVEQIITGHEGDIRYAVLALDNDGDVFIGFTIHPYYNYCNPTSVGPGQEFYYDLYCVNNKSGSWSVELVNTHTSNWGPLAENIFVDSNNNIHLIATRYGWSSLGGEIWEWVRSSSSSTWGSKITVVQFTDAGIDKFINGNVVALIDTAGRKVLIACRTKPDGYKLFYVINEGSGWEAPVQISDQVAVAWNRFDAVISPSDTVYIAYFYNNTQNIPELLVSKNFGNAVPANLNIPSTDTLNYFRLHVSANGKFTMYIWINSQNPRVSFSDDCINWSDPITLSDDIKNYFTGLMVRTDTRRGYYTNYCKQITVIPGDRSGTPYGADTLCYGSLRILGKAIAPELISPANSSVIDTTSVEFVWQESSPEITKYWFEIAENDQFNNSFIDSMLTETDIVYDNLLPNKTYYWRTKCKNFRGWGEFSETWNLSTVLVSVENDELLPSEFLLEQNYPNPFNPTTNISFSLPERSFVELKVFNMLGAEIASMISNELAAGNYTESFDAYHLSSGIYFYKLSTGNFSAVRKMTLIK